MSSAPAAKDPEVLSYLALRKAVGWVALVLPFALIIPWSVTGHTLPTSISAYYYTGMRTLIVGSLRAIVADVLMQSIGLVAPLLPAALLAFRETHPSFPRVSTLNQFFDTSTFVAYRNLGRFNARVIREARTELVTALRRYTNFGAFANIEEPHWAVREIADQVKRIEHDVRGRQGLYELVRAALT